jgi:small subunit ribosomal protein S6
LDSGIPDFNTASEPVRNILTRYGADILAMKAWDERRLAYEILGRKRGLYVLSYFKADPLRVVEIEHDCQLDERVLRSLILRRDRLTDEQINADTPATRPAESLEAPAAPAEGESASAPQAAPDEAAPETEESPR